MSERDEARFWSKVALPNGEGCMLWMASCRGGGYGKFKLNSKYATVHRVAYELLVGPIPEGLVLDHLCRVRQCVTPDHLEPVTVGENIRRGETGKNSGTWQRARTHCPQGHPYAGANLYRQPRGGRVCRTCANAASRRYSAKKRANVVLLIPMALLWKERP